MSQLQIEFEDRIHSLTAKDIPFGGVFKKEGHPAAYMRVKSVNFLNNSTLLSDVFARGDVLTVNLNKGTVFIMSGDTKVMRLRGKMQLERAKDNG